MADYTAYEAGAIDAWDGKTFVESDLELKNLGMSVNSTAPGADGSTMWHSHSKLEELYIFLDGWGEMAIDDEVVPVKPGTMVRVGENAMHTLRAYPDSPSPLKWLCVRAAGERLATVGEDWAIDNDRPFPWAE